MTFCRNKRSGLIMSRMSEKIQKKVSIDGTSVLYMINDFVMCGYWCFMTEHYTRNLEQALRERNRTFHINVVQNLAKQLISAVTILTNNNIIHSGNISQLDCN